MTVFLPLANKPIAKINFPLRKGNINITMFMAERGFGRDYARLEQYYVNR